MNGLNEGAGFYPRSANYPTVTGTATPDPDETERGSERGRVAHAEASVDDELSPDVVFSLLTNARRRRVLLVLEAQRRIELGELAERIAAAEQGTTSEGVTSRERKSVYTSLYQTHLPKLAAVGVVDYDRDRGVIERTAAASQLEPYLDPPPTRDRWWAYYLALGVAGLVLVVGYELLLESMIGVSPLAVAALVLLGVVGLTVTAAVVGD